MINLFKKQKALYAVCDGQSADLQAIPDEAFASGMLGRGFAMEPFDGLFYSPADGRVESIAKTRHAYTILTDDGLDVLVHIGVDTVKLEGDGFEALVAEGQRVRVGDPLARVDLARIRAQQLPTVTAVLVTNPEKLESIQYRFGAASGGKDAVMLFRLGKKG